MKELTIEEKAKAYDEVVNKLKGFMAQGVDPLITRADVQDFFPELKESDDERIRKDIVFYIAAHHKDDGEKARWLYWLEKQGGHAKFINGIQVGDKVTRNEDGVLVNLSQLNRVAKKQGEQKPADKVEPKFKVGDVMRTLQEASDGFTDGMPVVVSIDDEYYNCTNELIAIKDQDDYEYPPMNRRQKPADEVGNYDHKEVLQTIINEQKPAWSEEDEEMYKKVETAIDSYYAPFSRDAEEMSEWFRTLKDRVQPQSHWKPSEEQLAALLTAIGNEKKTGSEVAKVLRELYYELKKLRKK